MYTRYRARGAQLCLARSIGEKRTQAAAMHCEFWKKRVLA